MTTTLRMIPLSVCAGASLALSACSGGDTDESGGTGPDTAASQDAQTGADADTAEAAVYSADDLTAAVEAAGFDVRAHAAATDDDLVGTTEDMTVEAGECEVYMNTGGLSVDENDASSVIGTSTDDSTTVGGALGYADEAAAALAVSSSDAMISTCGETTISSQGIETSSDITRLDASVDGADRAVGTEVRMESSGQEITTTTVQAQSGTAVVAVTSSAADGLDSASAEDLEALAADMIAALP
jgi:hypothetical protein